MPSCVLRNCTGKNTNSLEPKISFHRIPKDDDHGEKWREFIHTNNPKGFQITKNAKVCSKHFKKDCFLTDTVLPRLTPIAVPTIMGEDRATDLPNNLIIPNAVNYEDMLDNLNGTTIKKEVLDEEPKEYFTVTELNPIPLPKAAPIFNLNFMDDSDMISEPDSCSEEEFPIEIKMEPIEEENEIEEIKIEEDEHLETNIKKCKKKRLYYVMDYDVEDLQTDEQISDYIKLVKTTLEKKDRVIKTLKRKYNDLVIKTTPSLNV